jgi:hypothetical protein
MKERLEQILAFNGNLAYSLLELAGKFPMPMYFKVMWSLAQLERAGKVESRRIGLKKYYRLKNDD